MDYTALLRPVGERLGWTILHSLWIGLASACVVALLLRVARRSSAALRHAICVIGLVAIVVGTVVTFVRMPRRTPADSREIISAVMSSTRIAAIVANQEIPRTSAEPPDITSLAVPHFTPAAIPA